MAVALLCSAASWAYTTTDLENAGWTLVTDFASLTLNDNYFVFVDAQEGKYTMSNAMPKGIGADGVRRPVYQALADPFSGFCQVWAIESYGEGTYAVQSIEDGYYLTSNGEWWSSHICNGKSGDSYIQISSLGEGKYRLRSTRQPSDLYWGPYKNDAKVDLTHKDGLDLGDGLDDKDYESLAANKATDHAPGFYLYAMSRSTYNASRRYSGALENEGWTKVTSTSGLGLSGYYYAFLDASENGGESGYAMTGTNGRPKYTLLTDPISTTTQLWTTESYGSGFAIKNVSDNKYIYSEASWNMQATSSLTANAEYRVSVNDGLWTLQSITSLSEYVGNYKNSPYNPNVDGQESNHGELASNKASEKGRRGFLIYSIPSIAAIATEYTGGNLTADTWYYKEVTTTGIHAFSATNLENIVYTTDGSKVDNEISTTLPQNFLNSASTRYYFKSSSDQTLTISKICDNSSYWFLRTSDYKYLSRGGSYYTQAIADNYGIPVRIAYEDNNINFIFVDNWRHLFDADNGNIYTDNNTNVNFALEPVDGGFHIINKNETTNSTLNYALYIDSGDGNRVKASNSNATVWILEDASTNAHKSQMQVVKDAQATAAAISADISGVSTQAQLDNYLSYSSSQNISITGTGGANSQAWQKDASNASEYTVFTETVNGLETGLYKLSVKAFERIASNDRTYDLGGGNAGLSYVFAGGEKVQLWSVFDYPADVAYVDNGKGSKEDVEKGGKHYPNSQDAAQVAFDAGKYVNEVFVWVSGSSLTFGIKIPHSYEGNTFGTSCENWICYNNFELTYYGDARINIDEESDEAPLAWPNANVKLSRTLSSDYWNTFCSPFDIDAATIASTFGAATKITEFDTDAPIVDNSLTFKTAETIEAGKPYLIKPANTTVNPTFSGVKVTATSGQTITNGSFKFIGVIAQTELAPNGDGGSINYFVNTSNEVVKLSEAGNLKGMRAYFNAPASASVKMYINGIETGIGQIDNEQLTIDNAHIYNIAGQRLTKAQKGVNIINGKKVLVK